MKDGDHNDGISLHDEEHLVWESPRQGPVDTSMDYGVLKRVAQNGVDGRTDSSKEVRTETGHTAFVPVEGLCKFRFRFGSDDESISHARLAILSRTTGQEAPAVGFLR